MKGHEVIKGFLDRYGITYRFVSVENARTVDDAARSLGVGRDRIAKTIIVITDQGAIAVFLRGVDKVDMGKLKKSLGLKNTRLASPDEVMMLTGYRAGGVPPVIESMETIVDSRLAREEGEIFCGGGDEKTLLALKPRELVDKLGLRVLDLAASK
ncbi:MAG TPA: YbaK/EbsC family protein [Sulfolobales archaeon]|nr:YbaK/EbsC family protein [Sulfolobales archaeon]